MQDMNKAVVAGNLTRDPDLRYTPNNKAVCNFTIASNYKYKDREETTFIDVVAWGGAAETISQFLSKGNKILVDGRLKMDKWEGKNGEKRTRIKINMEKFQFMDLNNSGS